MEEQGPLAPREQQPELAGVQEQEVQLVLVALVETEVSAQLLLGMVSMAAVVVAAVRQLQPAA